jgi:hypothetical protein
VFCRENAAELHPVFVFTVASNNMKKFAMINLNQAGSQAIQKTAGLLSSHLAAALKPILTVALLFMAAVSVSSAGNVTLKTNDAPGTSSVTGSTNGSSGAVHSSGKTYYAANASGVGLLMRTPTGQKQLFAE